MKSAQRKVTSGPAGLGYLLVLLAAAALYGISAAPDVLWQDSGDAILRAWRCDFRGWLGLALSHPSYYLLATVAAHVPIGEVAARVNMFSAICSAVAVANVFLLVRLITRRAGAAAVGALTLALSHTFWWHASVAEVYALLAVGITAEWLLLLRYLRTGQRSWLASLALVAGLNAANHMLAVFALVGYVIILAQHSRHRQRPVLDWLVAAGCWLAGFSPLLWLVVGELRLGDPIQAVVGSLLFGNVPLYKRAVLNLELSPDLLLKSCKYVLLNFPTPAGLLGVAGLAHLRRCRECPTALRRLLIGLAVTWLLFALRYRVQDQYAFFYPFYVVFAVLIGVGAAWFLSGPGRWRAPLAVALAVMPGVVYVLLPGLAQRWHLQLGSGREIPYRNEYVYFLQPWKSGYDGARNFGLAALEQAGPGGILLADSTIVPVLKYIQDVDGLGLDVRVQALADHPFYGPSVVSADNVAELLRRGTFVGLCSDTPAYVPVWMYLDAAQWRFDYEEVGVVFRILPEVQEHDQR